MDIFQNDEILCRIKFNSRMDKVKWKNDIWSLQKGLINNSMVDNNLSQTAIIEMVKSNQFISGIQTQRSYIQLPELAVDSCRQFAIPSGPKSARASLTISTPLIIDTHGSRPISPRRSPRTPSPRSPRKSPKGSPKGSLVGTTTGSERSTPPRKRRMSSLTSLQAEVEDKKTGILRSTMRKVNSLLKVE